MALHDSNPKHTSKARKQCLKLIHIEVMEWPSRSPHFNPLGWSDQVAANLKDSEGFCTQERVKIPHEMCANLMTNYKRCLTTVPANKGFSHQVHHVMFYLGIKYLFHSLIRISIQSESIPRSNQTTAKDGF